MAALGLLATLSSADAATAAGAGIELNGKSIGGYVLTWDGESREDLVRLLAKRPLTFEREFQVPVDAKDPSLATLQGKIRLLSKIRGDRQVLATTAELQLVKRKGKWSVEEMSLERALDKAREGEAKAPEDGSTDRQQIEILQCESRIKVLESKKERFTKDLDKVTLVQDSQPAALKFVLKQLKEIEEDIKTEQALHRRLKDSQALSSGAVPSRSED